MSGAGDTTLVRLDHWLQAKEGERLEFKEAKRSFEFDKLAHYCCALANEGGGHIILGVTDRRPRRVVGSKAFESDLDARKLALLRRLHLKIEAEELHHPDGRVVVFHVPPRPISQPVEDGGVYWMRSGESLVKMTPDALKRIFDEAVPDFSAKVCPGATLADLDPAAVAEFRRRWLEKSGLEALLTVSDEQLLRDAGLVAFEGGVTYAALVLLGSERGVKRHLAQAEVIFEYRSNEASIPFDRRREFTAGYLLFHDLLWNEIDRHNEPQTVQTGFVKRFIPTFNEAAVREVILNAVSHRELQRPGSVFVRQYPRRLVAVSPGGFPSGINLGNILTRQEPRNRLLAQALNLCGLVERSGQGMDTIFKNHIKESKPSPDFRDTDDFQVSVGLLCEVQNPDFVRFLEKLGNERLRQFSTEDYLVLEAVSRERPVPDGLRERVPHLVELGAIERIGRGRGTKLILSRGFYQQVGRKGEYTRKKGLDHETNKALLLRHVSDNRTEGSQLKELRQVLPALNPRQVQYLLQQLKSEGRIHSVGIGNLAHWYLGSLPPGIEQ